MNKTFLSARTLLPAAAALMSVVAAVAQTPQQGMLVLAGLGAPEYFPAASLPAGLDLAPRYCYLANIQSGWVLDVPFPKRLDGLRGNDLVVLADVPASALSGLMGRRTLRQFVERGQGLLVFGGPLALGKGEYADTAFDPALPVTTAGPWDLVKAESPAVKVAKASPITAGLRWDQKPSLGYYQKVTPRPGAEVLLKCGDAPVLVTGTFGQGRVAVFTGWCNGGRAEGQTGFYAWSDYPQLLTRLIKWLTQR